MSNIDYAPIKDCKQGKWTFGEICVQCNKCGRFNPKKKEIPDAEKEN